MSFFFSSASKASSDASDKVSSAGDDDDHSRSDHANSIPTNLPLQTKSQPIRLSSSKVWKRRGGLGGKFSSSSSLWEQRLVELRGSVLVYYDLQQDTSGPPRGSLDMPKEQATVQVSVGTTAASTASPSPFCLSIKVRCAGSSALQETKWKLCFPTQSSLLEWLTVLSLVVMEYSVDAYNHALLEAAKPSKIGDSSSPQSSLSSLKAPPSLLSASNRTSTTEEESEETIPHPGSGHGLWQSDTETFLNRIVPPPSIAAPLEEDASANTPVALERKLQQANATIAELRVNLEKSRRMRMAAPGVLQPREAKNESTIPTGLDVIQLEDNDNSGDKGEKAAAAPSKDVPTDTKREDGDGDGMEDCVL